MMLGPRPSLFLIGALAAALGCAGSAGPAGDPGSGGSSGSPGAGGASGSGGSGGASTGGAGGASGYGGSTGGSGGAATGGAGGSVPADAAVTADTGAVTADGGAPPAPAGASALCATGAMTPGPDGNQTIMATGKNRTFIIRMPTGYDGKKPFPVMFVFHGAGSNASGFEGSTFGSISKMAAAKAIRLFPQALNGTWSRDEPDDVLFMDAVMAWLSSKICYDPSRIYATGHSSGAYFAHRFACDRGNLIKMVATNSGGQRRERTLDCTIAMSAWMSTGSSDNPGHVMGTRQARDLWVKLAGCSTMGMPTTPSPCVNYPGCREGFKVNYCEHGGGHQPPGFVPGAVYNFLFGP
jgi:poly(3-hydroxybutyrate) depolymerase